MLKDTSLDSLTSPTVVNLNKEPYDIYIGRGSKYGNKFKIGVDGSRSQVIKLYRDWAVDNLTKEDILVLSGKRLGCFCHPKPCHGDILVELFEMYSSPLILFMR